MKEKNLEKEGGDAFSKKNSKFPQTKQKKMKRQKIIRKNCVLIKIPVKV